MNKTIMTNDEWAVGFMEQLPEDVLRIVRLVEDRRKDAACRGKTI